MLAHKMESFEEQLEAGKLVVFGSAAALTAVTGTHIEKDARLDLEAHGKYICSVLKEREPPAISDGTFDLCTFEANGVTISWISPASWAVLLITKNELMNGDPKEFINGLVVEMMRM